MQKISDTGKPTEIKIPSMFTSLNINYENKKHETPLGLAVASNKTTIADHLLQMRAEVSNEELLKFIEEDRKEKLRPVIEYMHALIFTHSKLAAKRILENKDSQLNSELKWTLTIIAGDLLDSSCLGELLERQTLTTTELSKKISFAIRIQSVFFFKVLFSSKPNPSCTEYLQKWLREVDAAGNTQLHLLIMGKKWSICKFLIETGTIPVEILTTLNNDKSNLLHEAVLRNCSSEFMKMLLSIDELRKMVNQQNHLLDLNENQNAVKLAPLNLTPLDYVCAEYRIFENQDESLRCTLQLIRAGGRPSQLNPKLKDGGRESLCPSRRKPPQFLKTFFSAFLTQQNYIFKEPFEPNDINLLMECFPSFRTQACFEFTRRIGCLNSVEPLDTLKRIINGVDLNAKSDLDDELHGTLLHCLLIQLALCGDSIANEIERFMIETINKSTSSYNLSARNARGDTLLHSLFSEELLSIGESVLAAAERNGQLQALAGSSNLQNELPLHLLLYILKRKCEIFKSVGDPLKPDLLKQIERIQVIALKLITGSEASCFQKNNKGQTPKTLLAEIKLILGQQNIHISKIIDAMGYFSVAQAVSSRFVFSILGSRPTPIPTSSTDVNQSNSEAPIPKK